MPRPPLFPYLRPLLPALCLALVGTALWIAVPHTKAALAGWVFLTTLLGTIAAIAAGANTAQDPPRWRAILGMGAVLFTLISLVKLVVLVEAGLRQAAWTASVAASWTALWALMAWALRRRGPGIRIAVPLGLASLAMALPVAAVPLIHWAGHWGASGGISTWQGRVVTVVAHACPFFPLLHALKPAVRLDWGTLPGMYAWSGLGQEVPLELPQPWLCCLIYAALAAALWLAGRYLTTSANGADPHSARDQ